MFSLLTTFFSLFSRNSYQLQFEYNTEYGPFLKKHPQRVSEPFYTFLEKEIKKHLTKNSKILDAGCGLGRLVIDLANTGAKEVVGVDTNHHFLFEAKAIAANHRNYMLHYPCHGTYQFLYGDIQKLPFPDNSFSLALCINVIDRITNPYKAMAELYRILEPRGILFLCDPYDWYEHITPKTHRIENLKDLVDTKKWSVIAEHDPLPFSIYINPRRITVYQNHLLILKKK